MVPQQLHTLKIKFYVKSMAIVMLLQWVTSYLAKNKLVVVILT